MTRPAELDPIVAQLARERVRRGISQQALSGLIGSPNPTAVASLEVRKPNPTLRTLRAWAGALGFEIVLVRKGVSR